MSKKNPMNENFALQGIMIWLKSRFCSKEFINRSIQSWLKYFFPYFFCSDKKGGKGKDHRNDSSDDEDSPQSGKIAQTISLS